MKFKAFKEFKKMSQNVADISLYLHNEMANILRDLSIGLNRLTFLDNFESFEVEVTLTAGQELKIRNQLRKTIPTGKIILRADAAGLVDGVEPWDINFVTLLNSGSGTVTAKVLFLK